MKIHTYQKSWQTNRPGLGAAAFGRTLALAAVVGLTPLATLHAQIGGTTSGQTITGIAGGYGVTVSTIGISYFTYCPYIVSGLTSNTAAWGNNYVFAGQGVASGLTSISSSDFSVSGYSPFIGTSTSTSNYVALQSGDKIWADGLNGSRGNLNNVPAGGTGIDISYKPGNGDPTNINFVQAYVENINGSGFGAGTIDGSTNSAFYNVASVAGTGTTLRLNTSPLQVSGSVAGWLGDQPLDMAPGTTNSAVYFQTFVDASQMINGTNYNVLYGGIQWGYTFNAYVPEPASLALVAGFLGIAFAVRRHRRLN
jgi:hypothetical protein